MSARATAAAPTPITPVDGAVASLDAVTFQWAAPPGAGPFALRVALAADAGTPLVELAGLATTEATRADALPAGPCLWWVQAEGGPWSAPARFVAGTPADVEAALRDEAAEADRQRAAERTARLQPTVPDALPEAPPEPVWPHATGDALTEATPRDWRSVPGFEAPVRADEPAVDAAPPTPLGPLGGEVVDAVAIGLRWTGVPGATAYEVELSPDPSFDQAVLALDTGRTTEVTLPGLVPASGHRLLWRVRARTDRGVTDWSKYGRFYPAADAAVDRFRQGLDAARTAERRQREHAALVRQRELDLVPLHERDDAVTDGATLAMLLTMLLSGVVITLAVLGASLLTF